MTEVYTAACLLTLPSGKVVFQRRTKDAPISAHKLSVFGGHHEPKESHIENMRRELAEETSIDVGHLDLKYLGKYTNPKTGTHIYAYQAHVKNPNFKVFEGERAEVYSVSEALARHDLDEDLREMLEDLEKDKKV
jgi:8-oxo-dGTP pyrophosphatase MutT (NUDIX family)